MFGLVELILFSGLLLVWPFWKVFSKAGFPGRLSLLIVIPIVNLIMLFYLAFAQWPIHRRTK
ncbi:hypothetical protein SAMN00017405_1111 [Desulfonispora thiosulfatigenes DSM 11270]|uniref:Uncharacterized protein n=1 Tax=Desulfonispora thiosulfatigenes DSM 11270 TaxID=656914 RepID=A0A1W1UYA5_DESTI|nr:hypothetical protein [Desulfonispora thiosulfatigenes]SMB86073.1 hypothetical protein SAMN00017405_1111 [Desulfonispora thiosulfatigenes DSM 11270]